MASSSWPGAQSTLDSRLVIVDRMELNCSRIFFSSEYWCSVICLILPWNAPRISYTRSCARQQPHPSVSSA